MDSAESNMVLEYSGVAISLGSFLLGMTLLGISLVNNDPTFIAGALALLIGAGIIALGVLISRGIQAQREWRRHQYNLLW